MFMLWLGVGFDWYVVGDVKGVLLKGVVVFFLFGGVGDDFWIKD